MGGKAQSMGVRVGQALGGIVRAVTNLPAQFIKLGTHIVEGLVTGIRDRIGDAINMVGQLGEAVASKFKAALGIHSPSRVFMGFGDNISQGAAIGISRSAPQAGQAASDLAQSAASAASAKLGHMRVAMQPEMAALGGRQATLAAASMASTPTAANSPMSATGGSQAGGGIVIHLTQTFNLEGAAQGVKTQIQEATQLTMREFERLMERYTRDKGRRGYA